MSDRETLSAALADRYTIDREIGRGGMATVYLARDVRHHRKLALKVLNPELGAVLGAGRFLAEIRVTANLQHPNLLPLFDSGEANGLLFYVMPFVDGETLRARLDREKQLPVEDAVRLAVAVASALAYAHEQGVIHRDLKPENILIKAGQPLIADFGIALAVSNAGGARVTQTGLSLGTPQYMSPEQAAGDRVIDKRSDIYSLGAMTYEMLAGEPPHTGPTAQAIIAKLLTTDPQPLRAVRKSVPRNVSDAVTKAMEKSPADRFATATDFAAALVNPAFVLHPDGDAASANHARRSSRTIGAIAAVAAIAGAVVASAVWTELHRPQAEPHTVSRVRVAQQNGQEIVSPAQGPALAVSPDGGTLVYTGPARVGGWRLWRRRLNEFDATPINGTEGAVLPAFSPDGREVAFGSINDRKLRTIPIDGGTPVVLADSTRRGGVHWGADGFIYYRSTANAIARVPARGGAVETVTETSLRGGGVGHFWPQLLPGGALLFIDRPRVSLADGRLAITRLGSKTVTILAPAIYARFAAPGFMVWATADRTVHAARFDPKTFVLGPPLSVLDKVRVESYLGSADFAFSDDGRLFYQEGEASQEDLVWVSRAGLASNAIEVPGFTTTGNGSFALSPDGQRVALARVLETGSDIWIKQLPNGSVDRLTFEGSPNYYPEWTRDGKFISFSSVRSTERSIFIRPSDGTGRDSLLLTMQGGVSYARWSPDGQWLVATAGGSHQIVAVHPGTDTTRHLIAASDRSLFSSASVSSDGRWISYSSDETGRSEVYVRPFPDAASGKWLVSVDGGEWPRWSPAGHELFYRTPLRQLIAAAFRPAPSFAVEKREIVLTDSLAGVLGLTFAYAVSPDGKRFLMSRTRNEGIALVLVENWFEELKRKVP